MKFTEDETSQNSPNPRNLGRNLPHKQLGFQDEAAGCPACLEPLSGGRDDCPSCGIVISQFKRVSLEKRLKLTVAGLYHLSSFDCEALEAAWHKVELMYYDTESHNQFIHMCYKFKSLPYAAKKYVERLALDPNDDIADLMRKRILMLSQEFMPAQATKTLPPSVVTKSLMKLFNTILIFAMIAGVFIVLISALTASKMYFFGLGLFIILSSLMSLLFMKHQIGA
jgi:hypothetical protein